MELVVNVIYLRFIIVLKIASSMYNVGDEEDEETCDDICDYYVFEIEPSLTSKKKKLVNQNFKTLMSFEKKSKITT
ncbi:hypothetical protein Glove_84g80 [Diversispora epigaea]|uniref:Uncharacterized protein n=1 Tax=Diversispora epigaea TaxID=1348612 RepID=A0A397JE20_9GLOM|nr:hypothetical protein Glove_84g80 [Diversispora epigaea]